MAKGDAMGKVLHFVAWLTGVIVSLAVGFSLASGALRTDFHSWLGGGSIAMVAGWIVVVTTIVSVVLAIANRE